MYKTLVRMGAVVVLAMLCAAYGCALFESERESKGKGLYRYYCMHCHGESGRQNEGFNWIRMPDPRPKDLSAKSEMSTFSDEEVFLTIYRDMKDTTPEVGDKIGDDEFAVPTMPSFKYTLSQDEIWSVVAHVRTLHGMSLTYDVEGRLEGLKERHRKAEQAYNEANKALEEAEARAEAAAQNVDEDVEAEEEVVEEGLPEEEALEEAEIELAEAKAEVESFTKRPRQSQVPRPDLRVSNKERKELIKIGQRLYENKYGCNGCHSIGDQGGLVGPALDRAGFRLNSTWVYRWIMYPQGMKRRTRMPNLGIDDDDAKAITFYLRTLQAPKPDEPAPPPA